MVCGSAIKFVVGLLWREVHWIVTTRLTSKRRSTNAINALQHSQLQGKQQAMITLQGMAEHRFSIEYIDGFYAISFKSTLNYSPIMKRVSSDSNKCCFLKKNTKLANTWQAYISMVWNFGEKKGLCIGMAWLHSIKFWEQSSTFQHNKAFYSFNWTKVTFGFLLTCCW